MQCGQKQPCCSCKSSDILRHIMKPVEMELPSALQGCLHPHPHPYPHPYLHSPALTAHLLAPLTTWLAPGVIPSLPLYLPAMVLSWWEPPCWLKASAASGPLGCPSSVYSAVKFTVSPTPSLCRGNRISSPLNHSKNSCPNT